jgi:hypothetical protein
MQITIGKFDRSSSSVPVTFEHKGVRHERSVNACLTDKGRYDEEATAARVDDVAAGVAHKIELGVITNPPEPEEAPEA